jgi:hypothetical protein
LARPSRKLLKSYSSQIGCLSRDDSKVQLRLWKPSQKRDQDMARTSRVSARTMRDLDKSQNRTGGDLFLIVLRRRAYSSTFPQSIPFSDFLLLYIEHLSGYYFSCKMMSSKRIEYHVDSRAMHAAIFFVACKPSPVIFFKIPSAMQAKEYSDEESDDKTLQMQVHWEIEQLKEGIPPTLLRQRPK